MDTISASVSLNQFLDILDLLSMEIVSSYEQETISNRTRWVVVAVMTIHLPEESQISPPLATPEGISSPYELDAEDAIRALDNFQFGNEKRRLSVEWARV
ncbi:hypothetical protein JHK85_008809 [Glycine max]|nr:hypothetical protein JHK87_008421 [Glycine soja]KAG5056299.1 hypothetical protein JHK85_008809 [Glycine max]